MSRPRSKTPKHRRNESDNYYSHFSLRLPNFPGEKILLKDFYPFFSENMSDSTLRLQVSREALKTGTILMDNMATCLEVYVSYRYVTSLSWGKGVDICPLSMLKCVIY